MPFEKNAPDHISETKQESHDGGGSNLLVASTCLASARCASGPSLSAISCRNTSRRLIESSICARVAGLPSAYQRTSCGGPSRISQLCSTLYGLKDSVIQMAHAPGLP